MEIPSLADFQRLEQEIADVKVMLSVFANKANAPKVVRVSDISKVENVSICQLYKNERYLLPRFGESAFPVGTVRWPLEEYLAWSRRDPQERYREWIAYLEAQRERSIS